MFQPPCFDAEVLRRYDRPGPRYTSYPTAPQFHTGFGETEWLQALRESNHDPIPRPLSLYLHVPFCTSPCFYCGCNKVITRDRSRGERYVEQLSREIRRTGALIDRDRRVVQLHFGGGTPNFLEPTQLGVLMEALAAAFHLDATEARDFSIELDPRAIRPDEVPKLAELGFNRASLGVQDFDPEVQRAVNRMQSVEQTEAILAACRDAGMRSINIDLIYGLPRQRPETFAATLERVIAQRPSRIAVYGYAHLPQLFRPQRRIDPAELPDAEARLALLALAIGKLADAGYQYIGMDHFALPDDPLAVAQRQGTLQRNFMGYTTHRDCDLIGMGVSAISHVGECFAQNHRDLGSWSAAVEAGRLPVWRGLRMDADDGLRAALIQALMCQGEIDIRGIESEFGISFESYFRDALERLQPLIDDGLVERLPDRIRALPRGRMLLRNVAMCFDRYLGVQEPARFSRAI
ncbi:MAG: coproporphyrinogen-III oxidase [Lysobacteraceae bacterium]|nr:MAG: coproporphyrinogen-III oxidase [Xanthomonadaceae bacterium]